MPDDPEDLQLALYLCYELHYRGLRRRRRRLGVGAVAARACARALEDALRGRAARARRPPRGRRTSPPRRSTSRCARIDDADEAPSLSRHLERDGTLEQFREFVVHRSAYQLKEADPHSWAIPRLTGAPKAALVEIQADEYGGGRAGAHPRRSCSPTRWTALGLDATYGAYLDLHARGVTLRDRQPDVAVRPAPAAARGDRRPPRAVRDDLVGARTGATRAGLRRLGFAERRDASSSTSTSRPTPCTRRSRRSTSPAGSSARTRAGAATCCGARAASPRSRATGRQHAARRVGGRPVVAARAVDSARP